MIRVRRSAKKFPGVSVVETVGPNLLGYPGPVAEDPDALARRYAVEVRAAAGDDDPVILDCRSVQLVGSQGLGILIHVWRSFRKAQRPFALCVVPTLRNVLEVNRLDTIIPCFEDLEEAARAMGEAEGGASGPGRG